MSIRFHVDAKPCCTCKLRERVYGTPYCRQCKNMHARNRRARANPHRVPKRDEHGLTKAHAGVLRLMMAGLKTKQIAHRLGIGERTVKAHCTELFKTSCATSSCQLGVWAVHRGYSAAVDTRRSAVAGASHDRQVHA